MEDIHAHQNEKKFMNILNNLKVQHKQEKLYFRSSAADYAMEFYKEKTNGLLRLFSAEAKKLLFQYTKVRIEVIN